MKKNRATLAMAVSTLLTAGVVLAGCGGGDAEPAPTGGEIEGAIAYSFWGTPARAEKVEQVIDVFTAEYPNTSVDAEVADFNAHFERLTVRAAGGDLACATAMQNSQLTDYAESDVFLDLAPLIESGQIETTDIPDATLVAGQVGGTQYMIPTGSYVLTMGYNEAAIAAAGGDAPTSGMTWEEYAQWARDIQPALPAGVYATENQGHMHSVFQSYVISQGLDYYTDDGLAFDKSLLADWFQYWLDLAAAGATNPASLIPEQYLAMELQPMAQGKVVTGIRDIANLLVTEQSLVGIGQDTEIVQFSIPTSTPGAPSNILGANGIAIPASCDNVATAAAFVNFFTNDVEAGLAFGNHNGTVTNSKVQNAFLEGADTADEVKEIITIFRDLTDAGDVFTAPVPVGANSLAAEFRRLFESVAFGETSADDAVDQFFTAAERALS